VTRAFEFLKCKVCNAVLSAGAERDLSIFGEGAIMQFVTLEEFGMARALVFLALIACSALAHAQDSYPSKPITMIVPFPPGGVADITGRPLAAMMEKSLKQPVVIVNRTGAGGALGMSQVAKSAPDGYTILMGLSSISIFPVSDRINGKQPRTR
jgi:tripartite-type tricarboxylate transporter receptor subunit TctC